MKTLITVQDLQNAQPVKPGFYLFRKWICSLLTMAVIIITAKLLFNLLLFGCVSFLNVDKENFIFLSIYVLIFSFLGVSFKFLGVSFKIFHKIFGIYKITIEIKKYDELVEEYERQQEYLQMKKEYEN